MIVSIITVNYNDAKGLEKTIVSVKNQIYKDFEHIIIDGNSNDGSKEIIKKYKESFSYWASESDSGIYEAMNKGIDKATGDYLLFLNSGDYLVDEYVLHKFIGFKPVEDIVYGDSLFDYNGELVLVTMPTSMGVAKCLTSTINHQTIFFNQRLFDDGSRYDCSYKIIADWVFINNAIIFKNCSTRHIDLVVPVYDTNGISGDPALRVDDRKRYLESTFDDNFLALLKDYKNLNKSFNKFKNNKWVLIMLKIKRVFNRVVFK